MIRLGPDERLLYEVRKHWFYLLVHSAVLVLLALAPLLLAAITGSLSGATVTPRIESLLLLSYSGWLLILWIGFFVFWTDYHLDVWLITDKRIIDIEQKGLFSREIAVLELENIEDITVNVSGLFDTVFDFGEIRVQTAGTKPEIAITTAVSPAFAREIIMQAKDKIEEAPQEVKVVG